MPGRDNNSFSAPEGREKTVTLTNKNVNFPGLPGGWGAVVSIDWEIR